MKPQRFLPWIEDVTQRFGVDILRMKGIIAMKDDEHRFVIQGVHMLIEGGHQRLWKPSDRRESKLVFIGRDLPRCF
jgi:G3E family GTPase